MPPELAAVPTPVPIRIELVALIGATVVVTCVLLADETDEIDDSNEDKDDVTDLTDADDFEADVTDAEDDEADVLDAEEPEPPERVNWPE